MPVPSPSGFLKGDLDLCKCSCAHFGFAPVCAICGLKEFLAQKAKLAWPKSGPFHLILLLHGSCASHSWLQEVDHIRSRLGPGISQKQATLLHFCPMWARWVLVLGPFRTSPWAPWIGLPAMCAQCPLVCVCVSFHGWVKCGTQIPLYANTIGQKALNPTAYMQIASGPAVACLCKIWPKCALRCRNRDGCCVDLCLVSVAPIDPGHPTALFAWRLASVCHYQSSEESCTAHLSMGKQWSHECSHCSYCNSQGSLRTLLWLFSFKSSP